MAEVMEALQKRLEAAFLGERFFIIGMVGAIILLLTSFKCPEFFWQYNAAAWLGIIVSLTWGLWRNIPRSVKYLCSAIMLLVFAWLMYNTLAVFYALPAVQMPPLPELAVEDLGALMISDPQALAELMVLPLLALVGGAVSSVLFLVGGLSGIMSAGRSE